VWSVSGSVTVECECGVRSERVWSVSVECECGVSSEGVWSVSVE
jgi:hypothetical protein